MVKKSKLEVSKHMHVYSKLISLRNDSSNDILHKLLQEMHVHEVEKEGEEAA